MSSTSTSDTRTEIHIDAGPVSAAVATLFARSTLGDHIRIEAAGSTARVYHDPDGVPFEMWGSGTQGLWRLLYSMAYTGEKVSLYAVVSRLDTRNRAAVAAALTDFLA